MATRRSAATLSAPEIDQFARALRQMKSPDPATGISEYDRFVALHGAVMRIRVEFQGGDFQETNMAHWNVGFCPWHRQYLFAFEQQLQLHDAEVTLPYWDWEDHGAATANIFVDHFAGSLGPNAAPAELTSGEFARFPVADVLGEAWGTVLERGGGGLATWPPPAGSTTWLEDLRVDDDFHPLWIFWQLLEAGWPTILDASHNAAHNFIGGHMSGGFSPNDPIFWMHHANVDRIWANWQKRFLASQPNGSHPDDWPDPAERSPLNGDPAPYGHRLNDLMWPWVGAFADSFSSLSGTPDQIALLHDPASLDVVRVRDVLDIAQLGYKYEDPR